MREVIFLWFRGQAGTREEGEGKGGEGKGGEGEGRQGKGWNPLQPEGSPLQI